MLRASIGPVVHDAVGGEEVAALLEQLSPGGVAMVLERLDLDHDQHYIEARCGGDVWEVEYRDGDAAHHYRAELQSASEVLEVLMLWAVQDEEWRSATLWRPLALGPEAAQHADPGPHDWTRADRLSP